MELAVTIPELLSCSLASLTLATIFLLEEEVGDCITGAIVAALEVVVVIAFTFVISTETGEATVVTCSLEGSDGDLFDINARASCNSSCSSRLSLIEFLISVSIISHAGVVLAGGIVSTVVEVEGTTDVAEIAVVAAPELLFLLLQLSLSIDASCCCCFETL